MKRSWLILGTLGVLGLALWDAVRFFAAPAEERVSYVALHDVYGQQQTAEERHNGYVNGFHAADAVISDSSGGIAHLHCFFFSTSHTAKQNMKILLQGHPAHGKPAVAVGENALFYKQNSGRHILYFQRHNLIVSVVGWKGSAFPIGSPQELAMMETVAKTFDLAIFKRQPGICVSAISNGYCLREDINWWWEAHGRELPRKLLHPWE